LSRATPASVAGKFFERLDGALGLGVMPEAGRQLAVAQGAHLPAQRLHRDGDAELLPQPLAEIAQPPAHHAMHRGNWAAVDLRGQRLAVRVGQQGRGAGRLAVAQSLRPLGVEPHDPVAHDLQRDMAQPRCLRARAAVVDRRQRQQTTGLGGVLAAPRQPAKLGSVEVGPQGDGTCHGTPPLLTRVNHITPVNRPGFVGGPTD
jgi:hypothetical protein